MVNSRKRNDCHYYKLRYKRKVKESEFNYVEIGLVPCGVIFTNNVETKVIICTLVLDFFFSQKLVIEIIDPIYLLVVVEA